MDDKVFSLPEVAQIIARMAKGGYHVCTLCTIELTKVIYSVTFFKEGEADIHVTGQGEVATLFHACLKEAHARYRAMVPPQSA